MPYQQNRNQYPPPQQQQYYEMNGSGQHSNSARVPQYNQIRQSPTPSQFNGYQQQYLPQSSYQQQQSQPCHPIYQHPPSPAPSNISYSSSYSHQTPHNHNLYSTNGNYGTHNGRAHYQPYQRVPVMPEQQNTQVYQRVPYPEHNQQYGNAPHTYDMAPYQRVPNPDPNCCNEIDIQVMEATPYLPQQQQQPGTYSPYQQVPPPKQLLKKTVSFEAGTKGGAEPPPIKPVVTPIIVNNSASGKLKCNLCRKKSVVTLNSYCTDCEFYMSRFKPKC